jgi:negative regulator of sigma E activity
MTHADDFADDFEPAPPDKLALYHRRQLSAMLDGEVSPDEAKFMLRRLQHDHELAACWERWQVSGDVLRGRGHALLPADFSRRVAQAIAADDGDAAAEVAAGVQPSRRRYAQLATRAALVASVAVVALWAGRQLPDGAAPPSAGNGGSTAPATVVAVPQAAAGVTLEVPATRPPGAMGSDAASAVVTAATGVAELPRPDAGRRARLQGQRATSRGRQGLAGERATVTVASVQASPTSPSPMAGLPAPVSSPGAATDPFATRAIAPARPWPRAVLPGLGVGGGLVASYPAMDAARSDFHPFEPRLQPAGTAPGQAADADDEGARPTAADAP